MNRHGGGDARAQVARTLVSAVDRRQGLQDSAFSNTSLQDRDQAFARMLSYGVLRWLSALQWLASELLDRPLKQRDRDVEYLILIGIFQLWKGGTAPHAAVHATAGAARSLGKPWAAGLINAVLRNFQRREQALLEALEQREERHAHPHWLLRALQLDWPEQWADIVTANNEQPPLWLRVNARRCGRDAYLEQLAEAGLPARAAEGLADAVLLETPVPVARLPGFGEGLVAVQDAAAQWAPVYLDAQPGQRVLDACAAPGGKTCHLLERTDDLEVLALDRDPERVGLIRENLDRLGLQAQVRAADASAPDTWWDGRGFDRILLDAPCSATGVIRRHPEIKWLRDAAQVDEAINRQAALLKALWPLLNAGGMLVYATCSVLKRENSLQIGNFIKQHPDAVSEPLPGSTDERVPGRQILPGEAGMDGFYYARLRKSA